MTTLIIDRRDRRVRLRAGRLEISGPDMATTPMPLGRLERIVLLARTDIDSTSLAELAAAAVAVHILPPRSPSPAVSLLPPPPADALLRCQQVLLLADPAARLRLACLLVALKTEAQRGLVLRLLAGRPDQRRPLLATLTTLSATLRQLRHLARSHSPLDAQASLLGLEGGAAGAHYRALAAVLPSSLRFTCRQRRPPPDLVNAVLSLLYTLATAEAGRCAAACGLDPAIGVLHTPTRGRPSLACDLMEPVRPAVDHLAWRMFAEQTLRSHHGRPQPDGACLLSKEGRAQLYPAWEELRPGLARRMMRLSRALVRHLRQRPVPWRADAGLHPEQVSAPVTPPTAGGGDDG